MYHILLFLLVQIRPKYKMSILADNLKVLRARKSFSQKQVADALIISRERLAKYEDGRSEPPIEILKRMAAYFHVSIDILVGIDMRKLDIEKLLTLDNNRILLPITVDRDGKDTIEIIPHKAKAGYLAGYSDPEYIENLQRISMPFLSKGKFRAFPIDGDSMPPHKEGSFIVGRYIENLNAIKNGKTYILITENDGIVYKRVRKNGTGFILSSDNAVYKPYEVKASDIYEIWEYACSIATKEFDPDDMNLYTIKELLYELRKDIATQSF
jgi:transcriptional regulator with XRE-family HTH domain